MLAMCQVLLALNVNAIWASVVYLIPDKSHQTLLVTAIIKDLSTTELRECEWQNENDREIDEQTMGERETVMSMGDINAFYQVLLVYMQERRSRNLTTQFKKFV